MLPPHGYGNAFQAAVQTQHIGYNASDSDVSSVTPPPMEMLAVQPMEVLAVQSAAQRDSSLRMAETVQLPPPPPINKRGESFLEAAWVAAAEFWGWIFAMQGTRRAPAEFCSDL